MGSTGWGQMTLSLVRIIGIFDVLFLDSSTSEELVKELATLN